eukprot:scaffold8311_cov79-Isochrysis_galbana.AAC.1
MANLHTYSGKELLSAEKASLEVSPPGGTSSTSLSSADADALCTWLAQTVPGVAKATPSSRLTDSPAIVVGHESAAMRRMMGMMEAGGSPELAPQVGGGTPHAPSPAPWPPTRAKARTAAARGRGGEAEPNHNVVGRSQSFSASRVVFFSATSCRVTRDSC